jgi:aromatic ring-cleaving dioxygenase
LDIFHPLQRPVEWIIWGPRTQTALVIIPEEAELVITILRAQAHAAQSDHPPTSYLVAYAAPVAKSMNTFNSLRYYSLPALPASHVFPDWFRMELGVLAGRLYTDFAECAMLATFLQTPDSVASDSQVHGGISFAENPAAFLLEWLSTRRGGQEVLHTPVGYVCTERALQEDDAFFL